MVSSAGRLRVLSLIPGRVRLHLPGWTAGDVEWVETRLCQVNGVESVQANPLTGNVLIRFDRRTTGEKTLLVELEEAWEGLLAAQQPAEMPRSKPPTRDGPATAGRRGEEPSTSSLIRVGVRGVLGHAAVDSVWFAGGISDRPSDCPCRAGSLARPRGHCHLGMLCTRHRPFPFCSDKNSAVAVTGKTCFSSSHP